MSDFSLLLVQVIGIYLLVTGLSLLLYPKRTARAIHEVANDYLVPYLGGAVALILGLLIVLTHNVWTNLMTSIVSLVGWIAVVKGALMFLLPHDSMKGIAEKFSTGRAPMIWGVVAVAIGLYLSYMGFIA